MRAVVGCAIAAAVVLPAGASAATIGVTTAADTTAADGECSLREAVTAANSNAATDACPAGATGEDRIELPAGTYELAGASGDDANASGDLDVEEALTIAGAGADTTTIDAGRHDRAIDVADAPDGALTVDGLTITAGRAPDSADTVAQAGGESGGAIRAEGPGTSITVRDAVLRDNHAGGGDGLPPLPGGDGGGVSSEGPVTIIRSTLTGNSAGLGGYGGPLGRSGGGSGGGVYATGRVTIVESTFEGNSAGEDHGNGGAAAVGSGALLTIDNSTFTANSAGPARVGGNGAGGAIWATGALHLTGSTISGNEAASGHPDGGGAISIFGPDPARIANSIVAGNEGNGEPTTDEITGTQAVLLRYSLIGTPPTAPFTDVAGNQIGTAAAPLDPRLGALADNGGPTQTMAPTSSSTAIDAGLAFGLATDQRGDPRPADYTSVPSAPGGDGSDIGAVELVSPPDSTPPKLSAIARKPSRSKRGVPKRIGVSLASDEACAAEAHGAVRANGRRAKLGAVRASLPGDLARVSVKLSLPERARRVARRGLRRGFVKVKLTATCADAAGNVAARSVRLNIKPG